MQAEPAGAPKARRSAIRFRGRSFLAMVLAPEQPFEGWLAELDAMTASSPGFFGARPVLLDLAAVPDASAAGIAGLLGELGTRGIRIMALENGAPSQTGPDLPPAITGGRDGRRIEPVASAAEPPAASPLGPAEADGQANAGGPAESAAEPVTSPQPAAPPTPADDPEPADVEPKPAPSLVIDEPVRSGQSVVFPEGDVTVIGSVGSGAEVIAGGSIHVYGALRGRAIAGTTGQAGARIFCSRLEAELLAIDGLYFTADQMQSGLRGRPVQTWLDGDAMLMAALDEAAPGIIRAGVTKAGAMPATRR